MSTETIPVCRIVSGGKEYWMAKECETFKVLEGLGSGTFQIVRMTREEYESIPVTNDSARLTARKA